MRKDLNKVLTERPRVGHKNKYKQTRKQHQRSFDCSDEDGPFGGCEGMRQPYRDRKQNSDLWSAIRRWMAKQVGRPWNDVFSEVCRDLHESDDMRAHFMAHVRIEVDEQVNITPNGRLYRPRGPLSRGDWDNWTPDHIPGVRKRYYVDPRDGILKKTPDADYIGERHWRYEPESFGWVMFDGVQIKYIDGIWYAVAITVRKESYIDRRYNFSTKTYEPYSAFRDAYDFHKRQLNSKELKKYGVRNAS